MHRAGRRALPFAIVAVMAVGSACKSSEKDRGGLDGSTGSEDTEAGLARAQLLAAFGTCAANGALEFRVRAVALDEAVAALAADGTTSPALARGAFTEAMAVWQRMEPMQFGPTGSSASVIGGQSFRDNIYAWPAFGRCAVEEALADESYATPAFGTTFLVNRRGLAALEYLLFYEGLDTECAPGSPAHATWPALTATQLQTRKRAYAAVAAADVRARATGLAAAWDPSAGNFVEIMRSAGSGSAVYRTAQDAIQSVGVALFYLDTMVKDDKLTMPLDAGCSSAECLESRHAALSKSNVRANLDGFRRILEGCDVGYGGLGFDDLLREIGAGEAASALHDAVVGAQAAIEAIDEPDLPQALSSDRASVVALRDAIQAATTLLKTDFVTLLGFEPAVIPTDND